ncbi:glycoside hydrolase family 78 protein [Microbacterium sediminicola]|uniref:alpha-L-rhamnosidase n=1 Tax=Microbacterium sediminicola TaxID=415210 RepID=A0ABP4UID2_9MICO
MVSARIASLTVELRSDSADVAVPAPRLSWIVEADEPAWEQSWAEVRSGDDIHRIEGADSLFVAWPFAPLEPAQRREVTVRAAATDGRVTGWSAPLAVWSAIAPEWAGLPIGQAQPTADAQPVLLRRSLTVREGLRAATLYWSALGVVDMAVNGAAANDAILTPGWTTYQSRLVYESADVTSLLSAGENVLSAHLGGGWFTEKYHPVRGRVRFHGDQPRLVGQLILDYGDGSREIVPTDETWRTSGEGQIVASGIYEGEQVDARRAPAGWQMPSFDDSTWMPALITDDDVSGLEPRMAPPVRRTGGLAPVAISTTPSGRVLLDFGQNLVGRLRLTVSGPAGTTITVRHAEVLDEGELARRPLREASQVDVFTLAGTGAAESFEPRFTFHGFRYVDIDGWPGEFDPAAVEAVILGSDLRRTGWFESSDAALNRFHENIVWTLRGNYLAVPQDCPQRDERLGWTGDTQLFAPTADFLYDCHAFLRSWLRDLRIEQDRLGGVVPLFAPDVVPDFADRGPIAAWGDAITIIPLVLADSSGDRSLLTEFYPGIRAWMEVELAQRDPEGLWTTGRQLADWLDPNAPPNAPARGRTDTDLVATAYLARTAQLTADIAGELGEKTDADRYRAAAADGRAAFVRAFVSESGRMMNDTQTAYSIAIAFELIDDPALRQRVGDRLAYVVRRDGYRIATGLIGTAMVAPALTATGHIDTAERLLFQTEAPSWLYPVSVGATTVWERWDGLRPDGSLNPGEMISFNHVALGSVGSWLHDTVAGLAAAEPGYRRLRIAPHPLSRLDHARAAHETPYGRAEAGWRRSGDLLHVHALVPANTTAEVILPTGERHEVGSGRHEWVCAAPTPLPTPPVTLDSSMADLADNPTASAAFFGLLAGHANRFLGNAVKNNALYTPGRSIRDALIFADHKTLAAVDSALRQATGPTTDPQEA